MLAGLRRSFPFYSPRYIAHQQSETSIASIIGTLAGTLYNSNNVTPESGIATVEWEIDACNALLRMLGYDAPPDPPTSSSNNDYDDYKRRLQKEFGWCHLTSGGTVANIEALWVARTIKYFPLAVRDVCISSNIPLKIKLSDGQQLDISKTTGEQVIGIRPNESIYLLGRFVAQLAKEKNLPVEEASSQAWTLINSSDYSPANGMGAALREFPPAIFVSGAAHYSIRKAADLLGIGRNAVVLVPMDSDFRLDPEKLRRELTKTQRAGRFPLAVISIAGTTEEGAVDPLHKVIEIREELEAKGHSFWIHVDAAWGGFIRSMFADSGQPVSNRLSRSLFGKRLFSLSREIFQRDAYAVKFTCDPQTETEGWLSELLVQLGWTDKHSKAGLDCEAMIRTWMDQAAKKNDYRSVLANLRDTLAELGHKFPQEDFNVNRMDCVAETRDFCSGNVDIQVASYHRKIAVHWPHDPDVGFAFLAMGNADSITVDPHKMGYTVYPNGAIAFRNDRVRHFIRQEAPYITSRNTNALIHLPIRHAEPAQNELEELKPTTQAFAPFTLEGSRPSASACSLWLSSQTMPFDRDHHGSIVRSSLLSSRTLYEWLKRWDDAKSSLNEDTRYKIVLFGKTPPDTNIVIFGIKERNAKSIKAYNDLNNLIYSKFSIQSELGRRQYSYSQPFFLSKTVFNDPEYPLETVQGFLKECDFRHSEASYRSEGLVVLRATVMNPYILPTKEMGGLDLIQKFLTEIHGVAQDILKRPGDLT